MEQWIIKFADDELKLVTSDELLQMEKTAEEFDGFYGWNVLGKLNKHDVSVELADFVEFLKDEYSLIIPDRIIDEWNKYYSANYR